MRTEYRSVVTLCDAQVSLLGGKVFVLAHLLAARAQPYHTSPTALRTPLPVSCKDLYPTLFSIWHRWLHCLPPRPGRWDEFGMKEPGLGETTQRSLGT